MKLPDWMRFLLIASVLAAFGLAAHAHAAASEPLSVTAFVSVNVLPMDSERVLAKQTVLIQDGRITAIGPHLAVPRGARIIDGHGTGFLSPGLADMHTHSDTRTDMEVYLANGVTTVLNMGGASNRFMTQVRPAINNGSMPGPHIYAAFLVDGSPQYAHFMVTSADQARWIVRLAKANGYEFIKVYTDLSPESFEAIIDEGRIQHMPVVGHSLIRVGLEHQLDAGQVMVAHTEEFLYTVFTKLGAPLTDQAPTLEQIPGAITIINRNRAFVTADLNTYATIASQWGKPDVVEGFMRRPQIRFLSPDRRIAWRADDYTARKGDLTDKLAFLKLFTQRMADAGVRLIAGTDAPAIPGLIPGYSLHEDLRVLEEAGLSRYQVLSAATRTPGELITRTLPGAEPFGTITPKCRADLILSAGNPLEDLSTLQKPLGVMANGRWYTASDLQAMLEEVAAKYDLASRLPTAAR